MHGPAGSRTAEKEVQEAILLLSWTIEETVGIQENRKRVKFKMEE